MNEDDFLLDLVNNSTFSFSRLNSFSNGCKYEWYLHYVQGVEAEPGFFSEYGSFLHQILEMYEKGELSIFEISQYYEEHFNEAIPHDAPPNNYVDIRQSYYDKGLDYLNNIDLILDNYEVLGIEKKVEFQIAGKDFVGYIDLLLKDKETGEITILDHKSASIKVLNNGNVSKSDQQHMNSFKRQLYLYSIPVIKEYGHVDKLCWNMFKDRTWIKRDWVQEDYNEAIEWATQTLKDIENETMWLPDTNNTFYCNFLCGMRNCACEYKQQTAGQKRR